MRADNKKKALLFPIFLLILLSFSYTATAAAIEEDKGRIPGKIRSLQVPFIENRGQIENESVRFYANTFGGTVFITEDEGIVYSLPVLSLDYRKKFIDVAGTGTKNGKLHTKRMS